MHDHTDGLLQAWVVETRDLLLFRWEFVCHDKNQMTSLCFCSINTSLLVCVCVCVCVCVYTLRYVCFTVYLPQRVDIEQRWLQLCQLDGRDAHRPDVTKFVVAAFNLHGCHLWCHPEDRRGTTTGLNVTDTAAWRTSQSCSEEKNSHRTSWGIKFHQIKTETERKLILL